MRRRVDTNLFAGFVMEVLEGAFTMGCSAVIVGVVLLGVLMVFEKCR